MEKATIRGLPTEVLYKVFQQISGDDQEVAQISIKNARLVSHHFNAVSSAFLIRSVTVRTTSRSLSRIEEICQHPEFRKSITHVTIDTSYYDRKMAADRRQYALHCSAVLYRNGEMAERSATCSSMFRRQHKDSKEAKQYVRGLFTMSHRIGLVDAPDFKVSCATDIQKYFFSLHREYARLSQDQEEARSENNHIRRICACLSNLPALQHLRVSDEAFKVRTTKIRPSEGSRVPSVDAMYNSCMRKSGWNGSFETAYTTEQPVEMLGELLSQLGTSAVRPTEIKIHHNTPADLRALLMTEEQVKSIHQLVSQASKVSVKFCSLARKGSLAENNDRSREEMLVVGSLFKALTNTPTLRSLQIGFDRYPVFNQHPTADLDDLLSIRNMQWPILEHFEFNYTPFDIDELDVFVAAHRGTVKSFKGYLMYLRSGNWKQVLDILHGFDALEKADLVYPQGGQFLSRFGNAPKFPREEAEEYVRGAREVNPLST